MGARTNVELHEDSGESPRPESKLGEAPWPLLTRINCPALGRLPLEQVDDDEEEALAATIDTLSKFSKSTSSSSDSVSESPYEANVNSSVLYLKEETDIYNCEQKYIILAQCGKNYENKFNRNL